MPDDNDTLTSYRLWLLKMATVYLADNPDEWQDLAQEGYIAMWRALKTYDETRGSLPAWLTYKAAFRMQRCAGDKTWTGSTSRKQGRNKFVPVPQDYMPNEDIDSLTIQEIPASIELAYHHGQIAQILEGFSPAVRTALFRRFWLDESVHKSAWKSAIPELQAKLAHLRFDYE
jgi:hypothetical protein